MRKNFAVVLLVFLMLGTLLSPAAASTKVETIHYIALGDSLAAGVTPYKQLDDGYADFIAGKFEEEGKLGSFTKEFSYPGSTSQQVLEGLQREELKKALKEASLVTISAGANDLLKLVKINGETGQITYDLNAIQSAVLGIFSNVSETVKHIKSINSTTQVYVMGYYFPYPHLGEAQKAELVKLSTTLDSTLEKAAKAEGAIFVPVSNKFGTNAVELVPNAADVHPTKEGYRLMAEAFFETYAKSLSEVKFTDVPEGYWAYQEIMLLAKTGVLTGNAEGLFQPEKPVTRAEAAVALAQLVPATASVPPNPGFKDVPENHPAYAQIAKMTEIGLFAKAEKFNPNSPLTRAQMSKIIALAFQLKAEGNVEFKDVPADFWAKPHINALALHGIIAGQTDGNFKPNEPTKRSHFAVILVRTMTALKQVQGN